MNLRLHSRRERLACAAALCLLAFTAAAQTPLRLHGQVRDLNGDPAPGSTIVAKGPHGQVSATSDAAGQFHFDSPDSTGPLILRATNHSMESNPLQISAQSASSEIDLVLHPSAVAQQITVTATRSSIDLPATANTLYSLNTQQLNNYPAVALDDKLRQQAGFELYRRSSSRVQNPTSQGISLRGLGSTAASRTLVLEDNVPMNDPFGGWIHWDEIPAEALDAVTIATGGGSDLYGSSALGGVIDVVPARPTPARLDANLLGGGQDTVDGGLRADTSAGPWSQLLASDWYRTAGYIPTAPSLAGPIDVPANVHDESARSETDHAFGNSNRTIANSNRAFLIANLLNEARGNRLWRYIAGDDWTAAARASGRIRLFGSDEGYRQSFSSVNAPRTVETLTRQQRVRTQELGASTDAALALSPIALVFGVDARDIRATDNETPIASNLPTGIADTSARQRFLGGFGEALASAHTGLFRNTSAALSLRLDSASNLDTRALTQTFPQPATTTPTPNRSEFIASPRLGLVRQIASSATLHASVFRAFRTPTMNELYRTGQVGQETTLANPQLQSERATGWELGATYASNSIALAGTYFWTEINRPVSAVLISSTAASIKDMRENLGQILSQGAELHLDLRPHRTISATLGYQYAHAVVTQFSAQPSLIGNWIPEVPRQSFTAQLRAARPSLGELTLAARAGGHAFDDSANTPAYILNPFFQLDLSARHDFGPRWTASLVCTNLLNQRPDVSRTPTLTLGSPFLAQAGLSFHWNRAATH
jgi:outer membrane receptor protein involved in Fe transport